MQVVCVLVVFSVLSFLYLVRACDSPILARAAQLTSLREAFIVFVSSRASASPALTFALIPMPPVCLLWCRGVESSGGLKW